MTISGELSTDENEYYKDNMMKFYTKGIEIDSLDSFTDKEPTDMLEFKLINPYKEKENWAIEFGKPNSKAVEIYVNGKEINTLYEGNKYGHISPGELYKELTLTQNVGTIKYIDGADLMCCFLCGSPTCQTVITKIIEKESCVEWIIDYPSKIRYAFKKEQYNEQLNRLKAFDNIFLRPKDNVYYVDELSTEVWIAMGPNQANKLDARRELILLSKKTFDRVLDIPISLIITKDGDINGRFEYCIKKSNDRELFKYLRVREDYSSIINFIDGEYFWIVAYSD